MRYIVAPLLLIFASELAFTRTTGPDTMTGIFNEKVRTLEVRDADGDFYAPPVVIMNSGNALTISFDHLASDREYLRWRVVRCDATWQPSQLLESEFLHGFNESIVEDYNFSDALTVGYIHYSFTFPNADINPCVSGNYLIQVYPENDPSDVWLQARVMMSEQTAPLDLSVTSRTDIDYNRSHQQISVAADLTHSDVQDPFNDLKVFVAQNGRADNEVMVARPLRVSGNKAVFEHDRQLIFPAGNEYRRFETSSIVNPPMGVAAVEYAEPYYHFTLFTDSPRNADRYVYDQTQSGRFLVRESNSDDSATGADYVVVHFTLDKEPADGEMIFLDGDFTCRRFDDSSRMFFNPWTGLYEKVMLLKQGHYNYQYLTVTPGASKGTTGPVEGDFYNTVNEYLVKLYTRGPLDRTDRLIGVGRIVADH